MPSAAGGNPRAALVVENENISGPGQTFGNDVGVVLARELVNRARNRLGEDALILSVLAAREIRAKAPDDFPALLVNDRDEIAFAGIQDQIVGIKTSVA